MNTSTEVQQQNNARVQIREDVPSNHAPPANTVVTHVSIEVPQQSEGVPIRGAFQHPRQGLQEGWVLSTLIWHISTDYS